MNSLAILVFVFGVCSCQTVDLRPYNATALDMFFSSDRDFNGTFDRSEMDLVFEVYDTNPHDGVVSYNEYVDFVVASTPELKAFAHELFAIYDVNKDGLLEKVDYDNFYDMMDTSKNGKVDYLEFMRYWEATLYAFEHLHRPDLIGPRV